jgi:outer membrane protein TolC
MSAAAAAAATAAALHGHHGAGRRRRAQRRLGQLERGDRIGAARAQYYPSISLTAALGLASQPPPRPTPATPDLFLAPGATINGAPVAWLNACLHFGSPALQASNPALARSASCRAAHGPGALLFLLQINLLHLFPCFCLK